MNAELDILISRYLDGTASSEEIDALEQRIGGDRLVAGEVYQAAYLDALLRDALVPAQASANDLAGDAGPIPLFGRTPAAASQRSFDEKREPDQAYRMRPRFSPLVRWGAIAASLLLAAAIVWRVARVGSNSTPEVAAKQTEKGPSIARIVEGGPGVTVERATGPWASNEPLAVADRVQTATNATAIVAYDTESTRMRLAPNTGIRLISDLPGQGKRWELYSGALSCQVDHQSPDRPLILMTPQAKATVVGTKFDLKATAGWTRLEVTDGTVRMTRLSDNATVYVSAGQYVEVSAPGAAAPQWAAAPAGDNVGAFWSTKIKPAGISE